jgi:YegS/Rv2252/BmrU family lipid kinase
MTKIAGILPFVPRVRIAHAPGTAAGTAEKERRSIVLVGNPHAGHARERWDRAQRAIAREKLNVVVTLGMDELDRIPAYVLQSDAARPLIVAAGGDGTIGAVASILAHTQGVLGILPLGTSNDVARSIGVPMQIEKAVHLLTGNSIVTMDLGMFRAENEAPRYFVHAAAMGVDVAFARLATQPSLRKRLGHFTYVVAGMIAMRNRTPFTCELQFAGRRLTLCLLHLSVMNAPVFGGRFDLRLSGSTLGDRNLDVLAIEDGPLLRVIVGTIPVLFGRRPRVGGVRLYHLPTLRVHVDHSLDASLDGEIRGTLPSDFSLSPAALRVIAGPSHPALRRRRAGAQTS